MVSKFHRKQANISRLTGTSTGNRRFYMTLPAKKRKINMLYIFLTGCKSRRKQPHKFPAPQQDFSRTATWWKIGQALPQITWETALANWAPQSSCCCSNIRPVRRRATALADILAVKPLPGAEKKYTSRSKQLVQWVGLSQLGSSGFCKNISNYLHKPVFYEQYSLVISAIRYYSSVIKHGNGQIPA